MNRRCAGILGSSLLIVCVACGGPPPPEPGNPSPDALVGLWQGASRCVNLELAPSCKDETVVFEAKRSETEGVIAITGERVVDGKREPMGGSLDFKFDANAGCWRTEFETTRLHATWCLTVRGDDLTGSFDRIPGGPIREVQLKRI